MKPVYICSRYRGKLADRRANLIEHDALCRYAVEHGLGAPVSWAAGLDRLRPVEDIAMVRCNALARSRCLAETVADAGGTALIPAWYGITEGMHVDLLAFEEDRIKRVSWQDLLLFIPIRYRAALRARVDEDPHWVGLFERVTP